MVKWIPERDCEAALDGQGRPYVAFCPLLAKLRKMVQPQDMFVTFIVGRIRVEFRFLERMSD
jgi:hypothetical protein